MHIYPRLPSAVMGGPASWAGKRISWCLTLCLKSLINILQGCCFPRGSGQVGCGKELELRGLASHPSGILTRMLLALGCPLAFVTTMSLQRSAQGHPTPLGSGLTAPLSRYF